MPRRDDGGFERKVLEDILSEVNNYEIWENPPGSTTKDNYIVEYDRVKFYLITNKKIGGPSYGMKSASHETDIAMIIGKYSKFDRKFYKIENLSTIECKNLSSSNVKRYISLDMIARNFDLRVDNSFIIKKDNNNQFNWINSFYDFGIIPINYSLDWCNDILNSVTNKESITKNQIKELIERRIKGENPNKEKIIEAVQYKSKFNNHYDNDNLERCLNLLREEGYTCVLYLTDIPLSDKLAFSAQIAGVREDELIIGVYLSKKKIGLKDVRKLFGRVFVAGYPFVKGVIFRESDSEYSKDAKIFLEKYNYAIEERIVN